MRFYKIKNRLIHEVLENLWRYNAMSMAIFSPYIRGRVVIQVVLFSRLYGIWFRLVLKIFISSKFRKMLKMWYLLERTWSVFGELSSPENLESTWSALQVLSGNFWRVESRRALRKILESLLVWSIYLKITLSISFQMRIKFKGNSHYQFQHRIRLHSRNKFNFRISK